jgi:ATP-dependent DNA helicase RecG
MASKVEITPEQAEAILAIEEGHFHDLKAIDIKPAKLTESVSAFANASGGEIFIGIDEQKRDGIKSRIWRGFADVEAANAHLQVLEGMRPLAGHYAATFMSCPGFSGCLLQLEIPKSKDILSASDGYPYTRKGAQSLRVGTAGALQRLQLDKGIISFEDEVVNTGLENVANSLTIINFMLGVIPTADPEARLRKQQLIVDSRRWQA